MNFARIFGEAVSETVRDDLMAHPEKMTPGFWLIRLRRGAPLIPARTYICGHEPGNPSNRRDRWPLVILAGEIAGEVADPLDIFGAHDCLPLVPEENLMPLAEYRYRCARLRHEVPDDKERHRHVRHKADLLATAPPVFKFG